MRSSLYAKNKGKYILIIRERPTQGSDDTTLIAQTKYLLILHNQEKDLYEVYTITAATVSYLLMLQMYINSKQKNQK